MGSGSYGHGESGDDGRSELDSDPESGQRCRKSSTLCSSGLDATTAEYERGPHLPIRPKRVLSPIPRLQQPDIHPNIQCRAWRLSADLNAGQTGRLVLHSAHRGGQGRRQSSAGEDQRRQRRPLRPVCGKASKKVEEHAHPVHDGQEREEGGTAVEQGEVDHEVVL